MMPISGVNPGGAQPLAATEKMPGAPQIQTPEEEPQGRRPKPVLDEYVPEEPREPSGRYWMGRDEDGQPKIYFDGPEGKKDQGETWECNTDKVDREIEKLKKKRQELEQRLNAETDEATIKDLERRLAQVERELKMKDSDTYRRQNAVFRKKSD